MARKTTPQEVTAKALIDRVRVWSMVNAFKDLDAQYAIECWYAEKNGLIHVLLRQLTSSQFHLISDGNKALAHMMSRPMTNIEGTIMDTIDEAVTRMFKFRSKLDLSDGKEFYLPQKITWVATTTLSDGTWQELLTQRQLTSADWPKHYRDFANLPYEKLLKSHGYGTELEARLATTLHLDSGSPIDEPFIRRCLPKLRLTKQTRAAIHDVAKRHGYPCTL